MEDFLAGLVGAVIGVGGNYLFGRLYRLRMRTRRPTKEALKIWFEEAQASQDRLEAYAGVEFDSKDTRRGVIQQVMRKAATQGYSLDYATAKELLKEF